MAKVGKPKQPINDLTGKRFGELTVLELVSSAKYNIWRCKCDCGNEKNVYQQNLLSGSTTTCGCGKTKLGKKNYEKNFHTYQGVQIEKAAAKITPKNNTSGFRGVRKIKANGRWQATIIFKKERHALGCYATFEEAVAARLEGEKMVDDFLKEYFETQNHEKAI